MELYLKNRVRLFIKAILGKLAEVFLRMTNDQEMKRLRFVLRSLIRWPFLHGVYRKILSLPALRNMEVEIDGLGKIPNFIYCSSSTDDLQLSSRVNFLDWEYRTLSFISVWSKRCRGMIDVGAYTGVFSIVAGLSNPQLDIFSFEPNENASKNLLRNLEKNGLLKSVNIRTVAAGSFDGTASYHQPHWNSMSALGAISTDNPSSLQVEVVRLDTHFVLNEINLIKIDVEGGEPEVIQGAANLIRTYQPVIVSEVLAENSYRAQWNLLENLGYSPGIKVSETGADSRNYIWVNEKDRDDVMGALQQIY